MKKSLISRAKAVLSPVLHHFTDLEVKSGKGVYLIGADGRKYLDFASGIAVAAVGHCHPKVVKAASKQTGKLIHACAGIVYYEANISLAEKLAEIAGDDLDMTFFCQSGAEAVEAAIKLVKYVTNRKGLIAFQGGFHGRTLGALSITTSKGRYREGYEPLLPNVYISSYPYYFKTGEKPEESAKRCVSEFESLIEKVGASEIAGVIVEPIQGEGGYIVPPKEFIKGLRDICSKNQILLIFDEVQTGFGRTGYMFAFEHFGVVPDVLVMAKALAGGFPLGGIMASKELMSKWKAGAHGSTLSGNPVSCAAALATIEVIQKNKLVANAAKIGNYLKSKLEKLKAGSSVIGDVRGIGLMIGVEFVKPGTKEPNPDVVTKIREICLKKGLILISCGSDDQVIRFIPPLIIKKNQIDTAVNIVETSIEASL